MVRVWDAQLNLILSFYAASEGEVASNSLLLGFATNMSSHVTTFDPRQCEASVARFNVVIDTSVNEEDDFPTSSTRVDSSSPESNDACENGSEREKNYILSPSMSGTQHTQTVFKLPLSYQAFVGSKLYTGDSAGVVSVWELFSKTEEETKDIKGLKSIMKTSAESNTLAPVNNVASTYSADLVCCSFANVSLDGPLTSPMQASTKMTAVSDQVTSAQRVRFCQPERTQMPSPRKCLCWKAHGKPIVSMQYASHADVPLLISAARDCTTKLWRADDGSPIGMFGQHHLWRISICPSGAPVVKEVKSDTFEKKNGKG